MKNIAAVFTLLVQGIGAIFDFAGSLQDNNLHEKQDALAIRKDWRKLRGDYSDSVKKISGGTDAAGNK